MRRSPRRRPSPQRWRRTVWASAGLLYLGGALQLIAPLPVAAQAPPLPTPCAGGPCGVNPVPTNFVTAGQVAAPIVSGTTMTIQQQSDRAILNWQDFNVASGYQVKFNQPGATAQALNRIWSADPSVIAGKLDANGQILLLNQNGIVFDRGAQVNVGALTASTLNITDERFQAGLLAGAINQPVFGDGSVRTGEVEVRAGAQLAAASGGRIMLLGSKVTNAGAINTPDGQTILAAGKRVYLAASTDPALRGLLIEVDSSTVGADGLPGTPDRTSSEVVNTGQISAPRGNVSVAGLVVKQAGRISATTAIGANGSIYLLAGDTSASATQGFSGTVESPTGPRLAMLPNNGGELTLAEGSVTEVTADPSDTGTITEQNEAQFITSEINLVGKTVILRGATVRAPGGRIDLNAATNPFGALREPPDGSDGSRIYIDGQTRIDAAGLKDVAVDVTRNLLSVRLTSNDLQDAPLQRDGFLRGRTVVVDARTGSTLFKVAPYAGSINHTVQEQLTRGGSITLHSAGDVITREGSVLDVSAGSIAYRGGLGAATTRLLGADGKVYDIATAPLDIRYVGFANRYSFQDATWGVTTALDGRTQYTGYTEGADAGTLSVSGVSLYLRGLMQGQTFANPTQRDPTRIGLGGALVIGDFRRRDDVDLPIDVRAPSLVLVDGATDVLGADFDAESDALPSVFHDASVISPGALSEGGFTRISLSSNGAISLESTLQLGPRGSLDAFAQSIAINADIDIAGGGVVLQTSSKPGSTLAPHDIALATGTRIDVSGRWTNDLLAAPGSPGSGLVVLDGGSVSLRAEGDVVLGEGSGIDVSGGAQLTAANKLTTGRAGSITLEANAGFPSLDIRSGAVRIGDDVQLRGASFAAGKGGSLILRSASLTIGDVARGTAGELLLGEDFFNSSAGGFGRYDLTGAVSVAIGGEGDAVHLAPEQQVLGFTTDTRTLASGTDLRGFTRSRSALDDQAVAVDLVFSSSTSSMGVGDPIPGVGDVVLAEGSSIGTGAGGSVTLSVNGYLGSLGVFGDITARGGSIRLQLGAPATGSGDFGFLDLEHGGYVQQLRLGAHADLDASGVARVNTLNALGIRQGRVLDGGSVSLIANKGFIVSQAGSTIDVSAASAVLDLAAGGGFVATVVAGDAGSIVIDAREGLDLRGDLIGRASDVAGSAGGTLSIGLGAVPGVPGTGVGAALYNHTATALFNNTDPRSPYPTAPRVLSVESAPAQGALQTLESGRARIGKDTLDSGGFDNLALKSTDVIEFADSLSLRVDGNLVIDAPVPRLGDDAMVSLAAHRVALGYYLNDPGATQSLVDPFRDSVDLPALGAHAGRLLVGDASTQVVDVRGSSMLHNVAYARVHSEGDLRLAFAGIAATEAPYASGSLYTAGDLTLSARQVYPTTATRFDIYSPGTVSIGSPLGGDPAVPFSAGGDLRITAHRIEQAGVLRAPLGSIRLTAQDGDGENGRVTLALDSLTSVSAEGALLPFGLTLNGMQYAYDFGTGVTLVGPSEPGKAAIPLPAKEIRLDAAEVVIARDASDPDRDARLDLSGGGDLYAYEFIAGPGGSRDVLAPASGVHSFAIVPSLGSDAAPLDIQYQAGTNIPVGKSVVIKGVPGLPDGTYTLLPARYALLPGAYAVQVLASDSDAAMQAAVVQPDGSFLTAARMATSGTGQIDSRTSTLRLTPGSVVRTQSQYNETTANEFFTDRSEAGGSAAPPLPADAGLLELASTVRLELGRAIDFAVGQFTRGTGENATTVTGIGGAVSIVAPRIAVTDPGAALIDGVLQLDADALNGLGAQTLIIGATRESTSVGDRLDIGSDAVSLGNSAAHALQGPDIILAAGEALTLEAGSAITTSGRVTGTPKPLVVEGDGAVLRASAGTAVELHRALVSDADAMLTIQTGASITAGGSLLLDSSGATAIAAGAELRTPDLTLSSNRVNVGEVPADAEGLNLSAELLDVLDEGGLRRLRLNSASTLDLYGAVELGGQGAAALELLQLNAGALLGHGEGDKSLSAGRVVLTNVADAATAGVGDGSGALVLKGVAGTSAESGVIALGDGAMALRGFAGDTAVSLQADREIRLTGDGALAVDAAGALSLRSPRIAADSGAASRIEHSTGAIEIVRIDAPAGTTPSEAGIGASIELRGTSIRQAGDIELLSGAVRLEATGGDVVLDAGSNTRAAGAARNFFDVTAAAPAGTIELVAREGDVVVAQGATVDVSAAQSEDLVNRPTAGSLRVLASHGEFLTQGTLLGRSAESGDGADFALDVARLADSDALNAALVQGGFGGAQTLRVRTGDVSLGADTVVDATRYTLSVDTGSIRVAGRIDTSGGSALGPNGGAISLWAGQDVDVSGATLDTHAASLEAGGRPGRGGDITLGTRDGAIVLDGAVFDQGGVGRLADGGVDATTHGVLTLRVQRAPDGAVAVSGGATAQIASTRTVVIEGYQSYRAQRLSTGPDADGELSFATDGTMYLDAQVFTANAAAIRDAAFGTQAASLPLQLRAGIEVRSEGDLRLDGTWNLAQWRMDGAPVNLSLRAAGNLDLAGSLSDGFNSNGGVLPNWALAQGGDSASYRLASGADLSAANPLAVQDGRVGDLTLAANQMVRTGTGDIALGVGGDLVLAAQTSVIYTAGVAAGPLADFVGPTKASTFRGTFNPGYSTGGGDVSIEVGGDLRSAPSAQLVSDWMWRRGRMNANGTIVGGQTTSWWTMFDRFQQGIATFGGGDLDVRAGGDIRNLSASVVSNGRLAGAAGTAPVSGNLSVNGGGQLSVRADGDILSGVFQVDWGNARVHAGGDVASGRTVSETNPAASPGDTPVNPIFVLGYQAGLVNVSAGGDLHLDAALNATTLRPARDNVSAFPVTPAPTRSFFYTLDGRSGIDLVSAAGDVLLDNHRLAVLGFAPSANYNSGSYNDQNIQVYPPNLNAVALSGDVLSTGDGVATLPAADASVNLLAHGDVRPGLLRVFDADPERLPGVLRPSPQLNAGFGDLETIPRPSTPLHQNDAQPIRIIAQTGDIDGTDGVLTLPKPARLVAGDDIVNLVYSGKNLGVNDVTLLLAGGDIVYSTATNANNQLVTNSAGIEVAGPGFVEVLAGGDINLGNGQGIVSTGNLGDVRLPAGGATLVVGAGFGGDAQGQRTPAYSAFIDAYLAPGTDGTSSTYSKDLIAYIAKLQGVSVESLDAAAALDAFRALPATLQLPLAAQVLIQELSQTGIDRSRLGTDYERGYKAIRTLFPEKDAQDRPIVYDGDINLFFSQIKTQQGGNINLLAPGGSVVVGLPNPPADLARTKVTTVGSTGLAVPAEANLGLLVLADGAIGGFAHDSFIVNQSRILTLQGGDIILWASEGDIDAGRGAKSASGAPPPVIQTDEKGNVFVNPVGAVSGSGIGQLLTKPGVVPGLVNLIAPKGEVNAGEAGIRVAGNLNIAAVRVIGADNISVSGTASGVPVSDAGALSGALSGANALGDAGKNASDQLSQNLSNSASDSQRLADSLKPSFVIVKLFCLGDECEIR